MKTRLLLISLIAVLASCAAIWAQVPQLINYQGNLIASGTNFNGAGQFKFALVNNTGSISYWSNDGTSSGGNQPTTAVTIPVTNGLFTVLLGDTSLAHMTVAIPIAIFTNADLRLRIWVGNGSGGFQPLAPDQRLGSTPYAMQSATAALALAVTPNLISTGTVVQVNTGVGLTGGPITGAGTISIAAGGVANAMLQNSSLTVSAANGLSGGGTVSLGGVTSLAANVNHDATLVGNGGTSPAGINLANANTWNAPQTFATTINGNISGTAGGFTGPLAGDVTGIQSATVITNLSANKIFGLLHWETPTSASLIARPNTGYLLTNAALVTVTLPTTVNIGDTIRVAAPGAGGWKIAQNAGQSIFAGNFGSLDIGLSWTPHGPSAAWYSIACSSDGTKAVGVVNGGPIYTSTDSGTTWISRDSNRAWYGVTSSADGTRLAAVVNGGQIYTSTNLGISWAPSGPSTNYDDIASSADGTRLVAAVNNGLLYTSADSGATWIARDSSRAWYAVASSADGTKLLAVPNGGQIYVSSDLGATWAVRGPSAFWRSVASSADGTKLVAVGNGSPIYISTDAGLTWNPHDSARVWYAVASSADGTKLVAAVNGGQVYTSIDSGATWLPRDSNRVWYSVACSADGMRLFGALNAGQIYVAPPPPISSATTTIPGTSGYLSGGQGTALELQYVGNNQFYPLSHEGAIFAY